MLTGSEILKCVREGKISITPFNEKQLNPNSYNLRIDRKLLVYNNFPLDSLKENSVEEIIMPDDGYILIPGVLYLGTTIETTWADKLIPCISGRSSIARLGIEIHRTAGFGDIGFHGKWTLEMTSVYPVTIYPGQEICQIYYEKPDGDISEKFTYHGKYQNQDDVIKSRMYLDK